MNLYGTVRVDSTRYDFQGFCLNRDMKREKPRRKTARGIVLTWERLPAPTRTEVQA